MKASPRRRRRRGEVGIPGTPSPVVPLTPLPLGWRLVPPTAGVALRFLPPTSSLGRGLIPLTGRVRPIDRFAPGRILVAGDEDLGGFILLRGYRRLRGIAGNLGRRPQDAIREGGPRLRSSFRKEVERETRIEEDVTLPIPIEEKKIIDRDLPLGTPRLEDRKIIEPALVFDADPPGGKEERLPRMEGTPKKEGEEVLALLCITPGPEVDLHAQRFVLPILGKEDRIHAQSLPGRLRNEEEGRHATRGHLPGAPHTRKEGKEEQGQTQRPSRAPLQK